jgi:hypothetical protein
MSNYVKATNFYAKDALLTGDPAKIIKGSEIDAEYNAIATAVSTKADLNSPVLTGVPTAPTAASGTNTTQVATTAFVITNGVPAGGIILWSGSTLSVPLGFQLCDGTNGTPDLRNRFVVGAGSTYAVNATGGNADAIVVAHSHTATVTDPGHTHITDFTNNAGVDFDYIGQGGRYVDNAGFATNSSTTGISVVNSATGVSGTDANLPPYYALAYIMKL